MEAQPPIVLRLTQAMAACHHIRFQARCRVRQGKHSLVDPKQVGGPQANWTLQSPQLGGPQAPCLLGGPQAHLSLIYTRGNNLINCILIILIFYVSTSKFSLYWYSPRVRHRRSTQVNTLETHLTIGKRVAKIYIARFSFAETGTRGPPLRHPSEGPLFCQQLL